MHRNYPLYVTRFFLSYSTWSGSLSICHALSLMERWGEYSSEIFSYNCQFQSPQKPVFFFFFHFKTVVVIKTESSISTLILQMWIVKKTAKQNYNKKFLPKAPLYQKTELRERQRCGIIYHMPFYNRAQQAIT